MNGNLWLGTGHTITSGVYSVIGGRNNTIASGGNPCAMFGEYNSLSYAWTFAAGYGNTITHQSSCALGQGNTINDSSRAAVALGEGNLISSSSRGIAAGNSNSVTGGAAFAIGVSNSVSNTRAGALGYSMFVSASDSIGVNVTGSSVTLGDSNVFGVYGTQYIKTHAAFAGSESRHLTAVLSTTDATTSNLYVKTLNDNTVYQFRVYITARRSDSGTENGTFARSFKTYRQGGGATLGTVNTIYIDDITVGSLISVGVAVSGNDVQVQVTGEVAKTYEWVAIVEYQAVSTSA